VTVTNRLSRLIVSFRWRPLLTNNSFQNEISHWLQETPDESSEPDANYPPNFILIGCKQKLSQAVDYLHIYFERLLI